MLRKPALEALGPFKARLFGLDIRGPRRLGIHGRLQTKLALLEKGVEAFQLQISEFNRVPRRL